MQLTKKLGIAASALLASSQPQAADWLVDSSLMLYEEKDTQQQDRISVVAPVLSITKRDALDDYIKATLLYDALSGASANGAQATNQTQNFGSNQSAANKTPVQSFNDSRTALSLELAKPLERFSRYLLGFNFSSEVDYTSIGASISYLRDLSESKSTTLALSGAYSHDTIDPVGGKNQPMSVVDTTTKTSGVEPESNLFSGTKKTTSEGLIGISHSLNALTLLSLNYSFSMVDGYQSEPYKLISVIDEAGKTASYRWESRPESRLKNVLQAAMVTSFGKDSLHLSYRYFSDSWGIRANTYNMKYHLSLGKYFYIDPHYRFSKQTKAGFFRTSISSDSDKGLPNYASADYRLADLTTRSTGALFGYVINPDFTLTMSAEQTLQIIDSQQSNQQSSASLPNVTIWTYVFGIRSRW